MSFYFIDNMRAITAGRWVQRVPEDTRVLGLGIDSREDLHEKMFVAIAGEHFDGHDFLHEAVDNGAVIVVIDRSIPEEELPDVGVLQVRDTRDTLKRLARAYRQQLKLTKVIAVTGTAGKTTTKELVAAALTPSMRGRTAPRSFNNEIGVPLTILAAEPNDQFLVVEIGTNGPGEIDELARIAEPDIAIITNVGHGHLEGLGTLEDVAREKMSILHHIRRTGMAVVNADVPVLRTASRHFDNVVTYGESPDADLRVTRSRIRRDALVVRPERSAALQDPAAGAAQRAERDGRRRGGAALRRERRAREPRSEPDHATSDAHDPRGRRGDAHLQRRLQRQPRVDGRRARERSSSSSTARSVGCSCSADMLELGKAAPEHHRHLADLIIEADRRSTIDRVVLVGELTTHTANELRERWDRKRVTKRIRLTPSAIDAIVKVMNRTDAVLVKGSRRVGLERVADGLIEAFGEEEDYDDVGLRVETLAGGATIERLR